LTIINVVMSSLDFGKMLRLANGIQIITGQPRTWEKSNQLYQKRPEPWKAGLPPKSLFPLDVEGSAKSAPHVQCWLLPASDKTPKQIFATRPTCRTSVIEVHHHHGLSGTLMRWSLDSLLQTRRCLIAYPEGGSWMQSPLPRLLQF